ncbi:MAG: hypothetical protein QM743_02305 [Chitinophagaceae bacterium]
MGGILDSARFKTYLQKALNCSQSDLHATVIGGHGDTTMIPLTRLATLNGTPVSNFLNEEQLKQVAADTMVGGATLTKLLGTSAWYAPGVPELRSWKALYTIDKSIPLLRFPERRIRPE